MLPFGKQSRKYPIFIKTLLISCIGLLLVNRPVLAEESNKLKDIYHVYYNDEYVGKIDDRNIIDHVINHKISSEQENYENLDLVVGESIRVIPEKVFNPKYNNDKVSQYLMENMTIKAKSTQIKINERILGNFNNEEEAKEVLESYQLKYLNKDELEYIEEKNKKEHVEEHKMDLLHSQDRTNDVLNEQDVPMDISVGDKIVKDIFFSEDISITEQNVPPEKILNKDEGVKLITKGTLEEKTHAVAEGEVLGEIANQYDLSLTKILQLNPDLKKDSILQIGQEINVTEYEPFVDVITIEETMVEEEVSYETEIIESDRMYKGEEKVKQKGANGKSKVHYEVEKTNGKETNKSVLEEEIINEPVNKVIIRGTKVIPNQGSGKLTWPADGGYVSSHMGKRWGRTHKGIDIARPASRTIKAADHGVVQSAGWDGGYGNKIVIDHNNGMKTVYAHLSSINVKVGQKVEKGSKIGIMGSTGNSTGVHLHFEVYQNDDLQNPMEYFQ